MGKRIKLVSVSGHANVPLQLNQTILFNSDAVAAPQETWFEPAHWLAQGAARSTPGGRGNVLFIDHGNQHWVLRHYRRGGLIGKVIHDQYLWQGAEATRAFRELRLLVALKDKGLPVPTPIAARYQQQGMFYRADLITEAIPNSRTFAQCLIHGTLPLEMWRQVGATIARFHAAGVHHADLNANNILIDAQGKVWLLDFDRGLIRPVQREWIDTVLERLLRSLNKLRERKGLKFSDTEWQALKAAHDLAVNAA